MALVRLTADTLESTFTVTDAGGDGSFSYNSATGTFTYTGPSAAEVRAHFSVTNASGDGSLSYNSSTGVITYTGPSAAEVRAHFSGGTGVTITDGSIAIGQAVGTTSDVQFANLTVSGNLTVNGTTTTINTETINLADNTIILNSNHTGSPTENAGIEINRGDSTNKTLLWNETDDKWTVGSDTFVAGSFEGNLIGDVKSSNGTTVLDSGTDGTNATFTGTVTGTVSSLSNHTTDNLAEGTTNKYFANSLARSAISVNDASGDGSLTYSSSTGVITYTGPSAAEVRAHFSGGTGVTITDGSIAIGQEVNTNSTVTFSTVTLSGEISSNSQAATKLYVDTAVSNFATTLDGLTDVTLTSPSNGQVLKYNSVTSQWVNAADEGGISKTDLSAGAGLDYNSTSGEFSLENSYDYGSFSSNDYTTNAEYSFKQLTDLGTFRAPSGGTIASDSTGEVTVGGNSSRNIELFEIADNTFDYGEFSTAVATPLNSIIHRFGPNFGSFDTPTDTAMDAGALDNPIFRLSNVTGFPNSALEFSSVTIDGQAVSLGDSIKVNSRWEVVTSSDTATANKNYFVNTVGGAVTITLPSSATIGDTIKLNDLAGTFAVNNLTVARNGHLINGAASNYVVSTNQSTLSFVYSNTEFGWKVITV
jgi:hypothetical protein